MLSARPTELKSGVTNVQSTRYVVITPIRDEEEHIAEMVRSVIAQTIRPVEWVIVNDGSTDNTGAIINRFAEEFSWIHVVHRPNRGFRKAGGGVVEAFYDGYKSLHSSDWDFIVKLDGDLTFAPDYFEKCFQRFAEDPKLGIGGGEIYHQIGDEMKLEKNPIFHVRGATKIYKKACWDEIGGLFAAPGWDTIDEVKANMLGFVTYCFPELPLHHHRFTGTADGHLRDAVKHGVVCYVSGYHPMFVLASCVRRLTHKPYIVGSAASIYGFLKAYWTRHPRVEDERYRSYIRTQQMKRLLGMQTIWK